MFLACAATCALLAGLRTEAQSVIIKATMVFTPRETGEDDPNPPQETNQVVYVKGSHIKSESKSDVNHTITIIDQDAKKTTQLYEQGGRKYGYFSIDTGAAATPPVRRDSAGNVIQRPTPNLQYVDSSKTIAGYACKMAIVTLNFGGRSMNTVIWYTKDLPLKKPIPTGGGGRGFNFGGVNNLDGFPMAFSTALPNGTTITYTVNKVDANANINDNEFDIPRGYDVKPESERPRGQFGGGGFRGGPGGGGPPPPGGN
jgi:GLPGLI family protein